MCDQIEELKKKKARLQQDVSSLEASADALLTNTPFSRYNQLYNQFDNRLYHVNKHPTGCQIGLTTGWMFVYTIQPVVKPV